MIFSLFSKPTSLPTPDQALPGRTTALDIAPNHFVSGQSLKGPYPQSAETIYLGLGCFWGAERLFWTMPGVWVTAVGYQGGTTPNPTYEEVCSGHTGHAETVMVVYDPKVVSIDHLLKTFWEKHNPTQGMRQGNDIGTQYRSVIYTTSNAQLEVVANSRQAYQAELNAAGAGQITTDIAPAPPFYFAETYHQQYLAKNPNGYCGLKGTGVSCPLPTFA